MKIVFLDFDGVINQGSGRWLVSLVERLNRITGMTGAKIVVHSSWRYDRPVEVLREVLTEYGDVAVTGEVYDVCPFPVHSQTPEGIWVEDGGWAAFKGDVESNDERCIAIQRWLDDHPDLVERFVILDDSPRLGHFVGRPEFLQTRINVGLTDEHVKRAIAHLKGVTW